MSNIKKLIAVDFDVTLTNGNVAWWRGEEPTPNHHVIDWVDKQYIKGNIIVVHTARPWSVAKDTVAWLIKHGIRYHGLNMAKMSADVYLDDKADNPNNWKEQTIDEADDDQTTDGTN